ncbi:hypothetical protein PQR14_04625 [Paraburkholderia bryophila]|nr:hypothetical protein [Burkholderia sp. 9120]
MQPAQQNNPCEWNCLHADSLNTPIFVTETLRQFISLVRANYAQAFIFR